MKKFKTLSSVLLVFLMLVTIFAMPVSALTSTPDSVDLVVTKYNIIDNNDLNVDDYIGYGDKLVGVETEAPTGDDIKKLEGAEFTIYRLGDLGTYVPHEDIAKIDASYDKNNKTIKFNDKTISEFAVQVTDENGKATFTVSEDKFGVFFVKETNQPAYVTTTAKSFVVELPRTNANGDGFMDKVYVYPKNITTLGAVILQKVDSSQNNKPLAGAEFVLYKKGTDGKADAPATDFEGNAIGTLVTDEFGYIYVNNLAPGEYYFKETKAPNGYIQRGDSELFEIKHGQPSSVVYDGAGTFERNGVPAELKFDNSSQPQVNKYVTKIGNKEQNVAFEENAKWIIVADVPSDMGAKYTEYQLTDKMDAELNVNFAKNPVKVYTTTATEITEDTSWTDFTAFTVTEPDANNQFTIKFTTSALAGAKKVKVEYLANLNEATTVMGDDIYNNVTLDYTVVIGTSEDGTPKKDTGSDKEDNPPHVYTGGFKFKKTSINGTTVLEGAVFDVLDANKKVIATLTSNKDGLFEIKGLRDGAYSLVETKAPVGHELLTAPIEFTVTKDSYNVENVTVIRNVPTSKLPLTGGMGTALFTCIGFALIGMGAVLFFASRKKKSN